MAQNFASTAFQIGTSTTALFTNASSSPVSSDAVIGIRVANVLANAITINVWVSPAASGQFYIAKNLSIECHDPEVIELVLNSPYKSFKFVEGADMTFKENIEVMTKNNKKKLMNFDKHSSGPYSDDIPGNYYSKNSILPYFLNNGLGWKDIHCSLEEKKILQNIRYLPRTHLTGFRYHFKNILPNFIKALKNRIGNK